MIYINALTTITGVVVSSVCIIIQNVNMVLFSA